MPNSLLASFVLPIQTTFPEVFTKVHSAEFSSPGVSKEAK